MDLSIVMEIILQQLTIFTDNLRIFVIANGLSILFIIALTIDAIILLKHKESQELKNQKKRLEIMYVTNKKEHTGKPEKIYVLHKYTKQETKLS